MSAGFTEGPWAADGKGLEVRAVAGQMRVCDIRGWGYLTGKAALGLPDEQAVTVQRANARLIAAAPDLYEALERFTWVANDDERRKAFNQAVAALAKARGEA
jgi:hypothetical protein